MYIRADNPALDNQLVDSSLEEVNSPPPSSMFLVSCVSVDPQRIFNAVSLHAPIFLKFSDVYSVLNLCYHVFNSRVLIAYLLKLRFSLFLNIYNF